MIWTIINLVNTLLPTFIHTRARVDTTVKDLCQPVYAYSGNGCLCGHVWSSVVHRYPIAYTRSIPVESCAITVPTVVACGLPVDNLWIPVYK